MTVAAFIGLGSNLEEPARQVQAGVDALRDLPQTELLVCSSSYRSAPVGVMAQPDFINAVCAIGTRLPALELMRRLLEIERRHGRVRRSVKGGARTLDLDLLLYGSEILATAELTVPHPRMHERAFVLAPLLEIAPGLDIPGRGPVTALLRGCAGQRVERLENC